MVPPVPCRACILQRLKCFGTDIRCRTRYGAQRPGMLTMLGRQPIFGSLPENWIGFAEIASLKSWGNYGPR